MVCASDTLPSRLATSELARRSVTAVLTAAGSAECPSPEGIAVSYRSDRVFRIDGEPPSVWSPLSGFWRTQDGWIRTHGNYAHHAHALCRGLGLADDITAEQLRTHLADVPAATAVARITSTGGLAVLVATEDPSYDAHLRATPLVEIRRLGAGEPVALDPVAGSLPLTGIRVLDLTRVIAGPVCTRTLASLGADVLRIDPPQIPEPEWQHLDSGHGKRTALLDARSEQMSALLADADVIVVGYRPAALARLGLSPQQLAVRFPGSIIAQLSAWGVEHPDRAGFDSLVQAESGIALIESADGETPGALPAQALDHSAGYLLAAAICETIARRRREDGTWHISTSLRRIAAELLGMPRRAEPLPQRAVDIAARTQDFLVGAHRVTTAASPLPGFEFAAPRAWGEDAAQW